MAFEELLDDPVIRKYLHELVGPTRMPVTTAPSDGEVTDGGLAEGLRSELSNVRHALLILYENDLTSYRHVRDEDSDWFTYLWTFHYENIPRNLEEEMYRLLDALEEHLDYEYNHEFYLSEPADIHFGFSEAMEHGSQCPETDAQLEPMDNDNLVGTIERRIEELRNELNVEVTGTN